jgi:hypothetical protein
MAFGCTLTRFVVERHVTRAAAPLHLTDSAVERLLSVISVNPCGCGFQTGVPTRDRVLQIRL